jgi:hypothetical protein
MQTISLVNFPISTTYYAFSARFVGDASIARMACLKVTIFRFGARHFSGKKQTLCFAIDGMRIKKAETGVSAFVR